MEKTVLNKIVYHEAFIAFHDKVIEKMYFIIDETEKIYIETKFTLKKLDDLIGEVGISDVLENQWHETILFIQTNENTSGVDSEENFSLICDKLISSLHLLKTYHELPSKSEQYLLDLKEEKNLNIKISEAVRKEAAEAIKIAFSNVLDSTLDYQRDYITNMLEMTEFMKKEKDYSVLASFIIDFFCTLHGFDRKTIYKDKESLKYIFNTKKGYKKNLSYSFCAKIPIKIIENQKCDNLHKIYKSKMQNSVKPKFIQMITNGKMEIINGN